MVMIEKLDFFSLTSDVRRQISEHKKKNYITK